METPENRFPAFPGWRSGVFFFRIPSGSGIGRSMASFESPRKFRPSGRTR
jgi:hypothetical protein